MLLSADTRYKGVLDVGLYVHLWRSPTGTGSDVVISRRDTVDYSPFCSPRYFGRHPGALAADHYPCGA